MRRAKHSIYNIYFFLPCVLLPLLLLLLNFAFVFLSKRFVAHLYCVRRLNSLPSALLRFLEINIQIGFQIDRMHAVSNLLSYACLYVNLLLVLLLLVLYAFEAFALALFLMLLFVSFEVSPVIRGHSLHYPTHSRHRAFAFFHLILSERRLRF